MLYRLFTFFIFFFNDTATTEIYTLSLHDALPISGRPAPAWPESRSPVPATSTARDRKSTRLNSSHANISYAVFCLKKKNNNYRLIPEQEKTEKEKLQTHQAVKT